MCSEFVLGDNGVVSTYPKQTPGGLVELPMLRAESGVEPPCHVCPKVPADAPERSPAWAAEFDGWVLDTLQWVRECEAVGDFGGPDPFMRAAVAAVKAGQKRADPADVLAAILAELRR